VSHVYTIVSTLAISTHVHQIIYLFVFWNFHFNKWNIPKYSLLSFPIFFDLEKITCENFNISENNIISVELAKVLTRVVYKFVVLKRRLECCMLCHKVLFGISLFYTSIVWFFHMRKNLWFHWGVVLVFDSFFYY